MGTNTSSKTRTITIARTELLAMQLVWALARLAPALAESGRKLLRSAFDQGVVKGLSFYGRGADGLCYMLLRLHIDASAGAHELQLHPRVQPGKSWNGKIAPEIRAVVEQFSELLLRLELSVTAHVNLHPNRSVKHNGRVISPNADPPQMAGWFKGTSGSVALLNELSVAFALASDLPGSAAQEHSA